MNDDRPESQPDDPISAEPAGEPEPPPDPPAGRVALVTAGILIAPAGIAALAGNMKLAIALGMLSIFVGLLGFSTFVYFMEHWQRRQNRLPRARARRRS